MITSWLSRPLLLATVSGLVSLAGCETPTHNTTPSNDEMFFKVQNYEQFMGRWSQLLAPQLIEFGGVQDGDHILDVGTGTGALAAALLAHGKRVQITGIDPSETYLKYAAQENPDARATFEVGDAQDMRFADAAFDRCLSLLVVNFIPDAAKAVNEMRRVTKSNGVIAAAVWDYSDGMKMLRVFWDEVTAVDPTADPRDERHMPHCTKDELLQLFRDGGLVEVEATALTIQQRFHSFDEYWAPFLLETGPAGAYVAQLSPEQRTALRERLRVRVLAGRPDQPFDLPARAWAVRGRMR